MNRKLPRARDDYALAYSSPEEILMRLSRIVLTVAATALAACSDATAPTTTGIGAAGGKAASSNNAASVSIPAGALSANTVVTVAAVASPPAAAGLVGGAAYDFGPTGTGTDVTDIGGASSTSYQAPRAIAASFTFKSISYGTAMCGITSANALYCWGNNATGTLGQGNNSAGSSTTPLVVSSGKTFSAVDASDAGTTCAIATDGTGSCWGYNFNGQVGDGTTVNKFSPVVISGGLTYRAP